MANCTCPSDLSSLSELCAHCEAEYLNWLADQEAKERAETIHMSAAQFFAAIELFDSAVAPEFVLTVRMERAA